MNDFCSGQMSALVCWIYHKEKRHPISEVASASFQRIHAARPGAGLGFHSGSLTVLAQYPFIRLAVWVCIGYRLNPIYL